MRTPVFFISVSLLFLLTACGTPGKTIIANLDIIDIPELNSINEAEVGETILSKRKVYRLKGVKLSNEVVAGDGVIVERIKIPPQKLIISREDKDWEYYTGNVKYMGLDYLGGLQISKENPSNIKVWGGYVNRGTTPKPQPEIEFIKHRLSRCFNRHRNITFEALYLKTKLSFAPPNPGIAFGRLSHGTARSMGL